jgi:hypothetical protein
VEVVMMEERKEEEEKDDVECASLAREDGEVESELAMSSWCGRRGEELWADFLVCQAYIRMQFGRLFVLGNTIKLHSKQVRAVASLNPLGVCCGAYGI